MTGPDNPGEAELSSDDQERLGLIPEIRQPHLSRAAFERYERRVVALAIRDLEHDPALAAGDFDFAHLQAIHAYSQRHVYQWAGQQRRPGEDTGAMGMMHCRPEYLDQQLRTVFAAIDRNRPSREDPRQALAVTADHWGELTATHPFRDGNSRSQRVFFHRYLNASGWEIDWRDVNASAVHAARHVAMGTADSSYLAHALQPGLRRYGEVERGSLSATEGARDARSSVTIFQQMIEHKRAGNTADSFPLTQTNRFFDFLDKAAADSTPTSTPAPDPQVTSPFQQLTKLVERQQEPKRSQGFEFG